VAAARILLEAGAVPTIYDNYGISPLHKACAFNQRQILRMILSSRNDGDISGSMKESGGRRKKLANLRTGEVSCPPEYQAQAFIDTPMHIAARNGNVGIMELLVHNGASVSAQNRLGDTPLHCAVRQKRTLAVDFLLRKRRDRVGTRGGIGMEDEYDAEKRSVSSHPTFSSMHRDPALDNSGFSRGCDDPPETSKSATYPLFSDMLRARNARGELASDACSTWDYGCSYSRAKVKMAEMIGR